jgi:hypothetical protein
MGRDDSVRLERKALLDDRINQQESYQVARKECLCSMFKGLALSPTMNRVPSTIRDVQLIKLPLFDKVDTNTGIQLLPRPETINDVACS